MTLFSCADLVAWYHGKEAHTREPQKFPSKKQTHKNDVFENYSYYTLTFYECKHIQLVENDDLLHFLCNITIVAHITLVYLKM